MEISVRVLENLLDNLKHYEKSLALKRRENFQIHANIWCLSLKSQYLSIYSVFEKLADCLKTLRQNLARLVSQIAFRHVSKLARASTQVFYQWEMCPRTETGKTENLHCFFAIFLVLIP